VDEDGSKLDDSDDTGRAPAKTKRAHGSGLTHSQEEEQDGEKTTWATFGASTTANMRGSVKSTGERRREVGFAS
jgi:hypothetical protein